MSDDPRSPFTVPPGAGPSAGESPPAGPPIHPQAPGMPPLGPPYVTPPGAPPPPQYPPSPPTQWPVPPPMLPTPIPAAPPSPPWTDRLKRPAVVWGAVAVVMAIVLGALIGRATSNDELASADRPPTTVTTPRRGSTTAPSTSTTDPTTTTRPEDLNSVVQDIERFVERERGLQFKAPVDVHLAGEGEFQDRLLKDFDKERPSLIESQEVLTALGLVSPGTDVVGDYRSLLEIGVVGFYDPETKQLVVRGTSVTPYVREVLAHELTHALDDQWFDLNRPQLDNVDDETGFGFLGLTEGDARRVENAYLASLPFSDQLDAQQEEQQLVLQHPEIFRLPAILLTLLQAPYDEGEPFVDAVLRSGGQAAIDAAFRSPPLSSEQILDPQRYLDGDAPKDVATPPADGTTSNVGVLGELLFREMLTDAALGNEIDNAITGWGGDRYVTWTDASRGSCLRDTFVGDTQADTDELANALSQWAGEHNGTVTTGGGTGTLTVCSG